ncbi:hypothetical protein [Geobacter sp.]|uniref:hypothetical protein n=1 Tax=Geobacter sp. TaxID=46610 RepID=UPI0026314AB2|nr:hypothetical protein [Geobacter sp.]
MAGGLVTIAQYRDLPEAGLAKSKLEAAGIVCFLDNEYTVGANWLYSNALGGVKLNVKKMQKKPKLLLKKFLKQLRLKNQKECCRSQPAQPAGRQE